MKGKYVMLEYGPVLFTDCYNHSDMKKIGAVKSAGFFYTQANPDAEYGLDVICHGESISLGIKAQPEHDAKQIKALILGVDLGML